MSQAANYSTNVSTPTGIDFSNAKWGQEFKTRLGNIAKFVTRTLDGRCVLSVATRLSNNPENVIYQMDGHRYAGANHFSDIIETI